MVKIFDQIMQSEYDSWGENLPSHAWCNKEQTHLEVEFLEKALQLSQNHSILDLFCSWGRHAIALAIRGYNVFGLDISQSLINHAKKDALACKCNVEFLVSDFWKSEFSSEFDVIYSIQSSPFEAWRNQQEIVTFLKLIRSSLKTNGQYLFGWANDWNRSDVAKPRWERLLEEKGITDYSQSNLPFYYYGLEEHSDLLHEAGLFIVKMYNSYDFDNSYTTDDPGLVMIVER